MEDRKRHRVYLGLGSNLGDREATIHRAVSMIGDRVGEVIRQSSLIETEPWGFESDNRFLNGAILCETRLSPREVLEATQQIERDLGRQPHVASPKMSECLVVEKEKMSSCLNVEKENVSKCLDVKKENVSECLNVKKENVSECRYQDRPIDIDILLYDDLTIDESDLKIPHPLMRERDFVMIPLREILDAGLP